MMALKGSVHRQNVKGPKTDPCGTPCTKFTSSEVILSTETHCVHCVR